MATLNYIGSKKTLLNFLDYVIAPLNDTFKEINKIKFLDGFAGTGIVGKYFTNQYNYNLYANDMEYYSYIINYAQLKVNYSAKLKKIIETLNKLIKYKSDDYSLISENYTEQGKDKRMFWTIANGNKADAIIENIQNLEKQKKISSDEYIFLLASVLSTFDKYANTASVYGAYLKKYKKTSLSDFQLKPIHDDSNIINKDINEVFNEDINSQSVLNNTYDIVYLDPPYNNRQYSSNYHPLNFIAKYNSTLIPYGKTGLLKNSNKSKFSISKEVYNAFENLIANLKTKYIVVSYNNEGLLAFEKFKSILEAKGKTTLYKYKYKKFKSSDKQKDQIVYEYLYLCEVEQKGNFQEIILDKLQ